MACYKHIIRLESEIAKKIGSRPVRDLLKSTVMTEVIDTIVDDLYDGCVIMPNCCALDEETKKIFYC